MYDIIVIGGGPAGMTAAIYGQRLGKSVLVMEKEGFGGQITHSPRVENYPGFASVSGTELADHMMEQMLSQGAEIELAEAVSVHPSSESPAGEDSASAFTVETEDGECFTARAVILATGVKHRVLGLPGEEELTGEGISYCAVCDGDFYAGKTVALVGGGDSALQEAILLSDKCSKVIVIHRRDTFRAEQKLQDILLSRPNVQTVMNTKVTGFLTDDLQQFRGVQTASVLSDNADGGEASRNIPCDGLFISIGQVPSNDAFAELADLDAAGYFDAKENCRTRTPGVFIAGDCRQKKVRQLTTAVADGAVAAMAACDYLNGLG